jgi:hypothetical protein
MGISTFDSRASLPGCPILNVAEIVRSQPHSSSATLGGVDFGLSGDAPDLLSRVIPTRADHREGDDLRSGEPALSEVEGDLVLNVCMDGVKNESKWTARKHERAVERFSPAVDLAHSSQTGLEWATRR